MASKDFYTVEEIADLLRVQVSAVRNRLSRGDPTLPPSLRVGGRRLFPVAAYEKWINALVDSSKSNGTDIPSLATTETRRGRPRQTSRGLA
jgi:hypothetical protein